MFKIFSRKEDLTDIKEILANLDLNESYKEDPYSFFRKDSSSEKDLLDSDAQYEYKDEITDANNCVWRRYITS